LNESGFTTSSGIGDGTYEVYFHKEENGDVFSIEIVFLREKLRTVEVKGEIYVNLDDLYDFLESSEFGGEDISNELQNLLTRDEEDFE